MLETSLQGQNHNVSGYRDALVNALNKTVEIFTSHHEESFEEVISRGIPPVAEAAGLDRIAVYRVLDRKSSSIGQIFVWAYGKIVPLDEKLKELPNVPPVISLLERAKKGECINANVKKMTKDNADFCAMYGVKAALFVPIFNHGEFWGFVALEDHTNYRFFEEDCLDLLRSTAYLCANAFIRNEMMKNADSAIKALLRREKNTSTLNQMAITFLSNNEETFEDMMNVGIKLIVNLTDIDRFSVWRNKMTNNGLYTSQIYRWDKQSGGTTKPTKGLEYVAYSNLAPRWENYLASGKEMNSPVKLMPEAEMLQSFGVVSAFVTPVFINNAFWGFVLFEDRENERYFDEDYIEMMRSAAFLCVNTVIRADMEKNIREQSELLKIRLEQQELISDISRGFIASGDSGTHVKEAIAKLGSYHKVSQVIIFNIDNKKQKSYPAHFWSDDDSYMKLVNMNLFEITKSCFPEILPDCSTLPVLFCEDISASSVEAYSVLLSIDIHAFIMAPLYVEGRLWGILVVEQRSRPRKWTDNEKGFVAMTAGTIAGVIMRNIYNTMLREALEKATIASKAKGEFLSNMSHEMRTPLNAIIGMTTIAKNAVDLEHKNHALDKISDASTHLLGVINDVLDMSKIEANKLELSSVEYNFERALQKSVAIITFRIEEKHQQLKVNIDKAIPEILIGDDQRLIQVITNLLGNAVKFTPEDGSINLNAYLLGEENGLCTIQISVTDTGIGLSEEQITRLFQSFQQAEASTVRKYGGSGLGLAICKNIVGMMGGKIWVESQLNKGSTFSFTIRGKRGEGKAKNYGINGHLATKFPAHAKGTDPSNTSGIFTGRRILLVEDIEVNREIVLTILEPSELEIDCAENGIRAVEMFREEPERYDMIFMDVQMPEMDGYDATRCIRAVEDELYRGLPHLQRSFQQKRIPIIAMTANVFKEDIDKCLDAGMDDHIGKPLDFEVVMEKLRFYLK